MQKVELATSDGKLIGSTYIESSSPERAARLIVCRGRCYAKNDLRTPMDGGALVYEEIPAIHVAGYWGLSSDPAAVMC